ncbi:MAG: shikimate dehydrogenase [bacterium P3]|nr:MAG: shikimate dehydrogenase [bacterium P3]KWW42471.1 MAG: shikimate dehydrogenase [bacterium F083]
MLHVGLIGIPLGHSGSADYFARHHKDCRYCAYELPSLDNLRLLLEQEQLDGFNVTLPYKTAILPHLDTVDDDASAIGAVNCVSVRRSGGLMHLTGHNTDCPAFAETLQPLLQPWHRQALVLGTGGAARAVSHALQQLGIGVTRVSRTPRGAGTIGYGEVAALINSHLLVVNATPVGMWPQVEQTPLPDTCGIGPRHLCYDLIYNPVESRWLHEAALQGATVCNGLSMLHRQADMSHRLWTERPRF